MNWGLLLKLSTFGFAMAIATIELIPFEFELILWVFIFGFCAYAIVKQCTESLFMHGFMLSMITCIYYTVFHFAFFETYAASHTALMSQVNQVVPPGSNQKPLVVAFGVVFCVISGIIQGLFCHFMAKSQKTAA